MNLKYYGTLLLSAILMLFASVESIEAGISEKALSEQQTVISGTVVDARTGNTMAGVNVLIKGTLRGVATDIR